MNRIAHRVTASPEIGLLRWAVNLYRRDETPDPDSSGTIETLVPLGTAHADVAAFHPVQLWGGTQIEGPATHLIRMRWLDYVPTTDVIMLATERPTDGTIRTETYRVRRTKEIEGRTRFVELECELERVD